MSTNELYHEIQTPTTSYLIASTVLYLGVKCVRTLRLFGTPSLWE